MSFNPYDDEFNQSFDALPKGKYMMVIEKSEVTGYHKKKTDQPFPKALYVKLELTNLGLLDGEFLDESRKGAKVFDYILLSHGPEAASQEIDKNDKFVLISRKRFSALWRALGLPPAPSDEVMIQEINQLKGKQIQVSIKVNKATEAYPDPSNGVTTYLATIKNESSEWNLKS